jgi:cell division protease FtsH
LKKFPRGMPVYIALLGAFLLISSLLSGNRTAVPEWEYSQFLSEVAAGNVDRVAIREDTLFGLLKDSVTPLSAFPGRSDFTTIIGADLIDTLRVMKAKQLGVLPETVSAADLDIKVDYLPALVTPWYLELLSYIFPALLVMVLFWFMMRRQAGGGSQVMGFGKSRATLADPTKNKITFADVAGADEEKEELREIVDFLKDPKQYLELGARIPRGVLLVGPPGTGKTLLAKAVAGEADAPFFSISGSDFVEMFVGVGASRVRDLFEQAKKKAPSIVFIDEIDAVGRHRGSGIGGGHDEREQTLNQLLVELDGFAPNEGVIVMAATNRADILDPALLRPGRFDRQVTVNRPDITGRMAILKVHSKGKPLAEDVDLENIAKRTPFSTGADLENIMNEGALLAARRQQTRITQALLVEAVERVQMGPEKRSHKVLEEDKRISAYHEAGHAIVGFNLPLCEEVHTVSIVPRGQAGGFTLLLPRQEFDTQSRDALLQRLAMSLGGHAAVMLTQNDFYTGSQSDLKRATEICRRMVTELGMSDKMGTIYLGDGQEVIVGMQFGRESDHSENTSAAIDHEVRDILAACYKQAMNILKANTARLHALAALLIEKEIVYREEFVAFMNSPVI